MYSIANRVPKENEIDNPEDKKDVFVNALLKSPASLLSEINERIMGDENGLEVSKKLSEIKTNENHLIIYIPLKFIMVRYLLKLYLTILFVPYLQCHQPQDRLFWHSLFGLIVLHYLLKYLEVLSFHLI